MSAKTAWMIVGFAGQACFFVRFLVQWIASERVKRSIVPEVFWYFSLAGTILSGLYVWLKPSPDLVYAASYAFNVVVYGRNIVLARRPGRSWPLPIVASFAGIIAFVTVWALRHDPRVMQSFRETSVFWVGLVIIGQTLWCGRFLLQWVLAERSGRAELATSFFAISFVASFILLAYAIHVRDSVLIAGQVVGPIVYFRNLVLLRRSVAVSSAV